MDLDGKIARRALLVNALTTLALGCATSRAYAASGVTRPSGAGAAVSLAAGPLRDVPAQEIFDGRGGTFRVEAPVIMGPGSTMRNVTLILAVPGMQGRAAILVSSGCTLENVTIIGTGTRGSAARPFVERGVAPASDGVTDVMLDVRVSRCTVGVHICAPHGGRAPARWRGRIHVEDIVGHDGQSEGYGVLLSPAQACNLVVSARDVNRHAVYLSNGAAHNVIWLDSVGGRHSPVALYSKQQQPATHSNRITARIRGAVAGTGDPMATYGAHLLGKVTGNTIDLDVAECAVAGAVLLRSATAQAVCRGNTITARVTGDGFTAAIVNSEAARSNRIALSGACSTTSAAHALVRVAPYNKIELTPGLEPALTIDALSVDCRGRHMAALMCSESAAPTIVYRDRVRLRRTSRPDWYADRSARPGRHSCLTLRPGRP